jgi:hypothetical protein
MHSPPTIDAYLRVTNSERFRGLHDVAESVITNLARDFDAEVQAVPNPYRNLLPDDKIIRSLRLTPRAVKAAPIIITFTTFPGLVVTIGKSITHAFPACGCDACAETFEGESERFLRVIESATSGEMFDQKRNILKRIFGFLFSSRKPWPQHRASHPR